MRVDISSIIERRTCGTAQILKAQSYLHFNVGVESVKTELANEQVLVTGVLEPEKLMKEVIKKTRKQASIVVKEEEKKEEKKVEAKKEEDMNIETKKKEYWPPMYYMDYAYAPQIFSDENPHACLLM